MPTINHLVHPQRLPPKIQPTVRADGTVAFCSLGRAANPLFTSVGCDDKVDLTLQFRWGSMEGGVRENSESDRLASPLSPYLLPPLKSTQWDSLAHVGALHDPFGDGNLVPMFYNGYKAGVDVVGPVEYDLETGKMKDGRKEHVGALKLGVENMAEKVGLGCVFLGREERRRRLICSLCPLCPSLVLLALLDPSQFKDAP